MSSLQKTVLAWLLSVVVAGAAPVLEETDGHLHVRFDNGVQLSFLVESGLFLGLHEARFEGRALKSSRTCQWPLIGNDTTDRPTATVAYRLKNSVVEGNRVILTLEAEVTKDFSAIRRLYQIAPDRDAALAQPDEALRLAIQANEQAAALIQAAIEADPRWQEAVRLAEDARQRADGAPGADKKRLNGEARKRESERDALRSALPVTLGTEKPEIARALETQAAYARERDRLGLQIGKVHRDAHRFTALQLPSETVTPDKLRALAALPVARQTAGTVQWILSADSESIAGWPWRGWRQELKVHFQAPHTFNHVRMLGSWEIDGQAAGLGVVNFRYRGLGPIAHTFTGDSEKGVGETWTTTETLAGAVQSAPLISPVVPTFQSVTDRGYGLQHRAGAWICRLPRGAGVNFLDFQWRPGLLFTGFPVRQGNLRALTEAFTGDRELSQTDDEIFPVGLQATTTPFRYLVLSAEPVFAWNEIQTRWGEVDQFVRDAVSAELEFVQFEPEPTQGFIVDNGWDGWMKTLTARLDRYAELGIRSIGTHNPGWINGRYQGPGGPPRTGGGVCLVYDWIPTRDVETLWRTMTGKMKSLGMTYYVWFGTYNWGEAPFVQSVGTGDEFWSVKADGTTIDDNAGVFPHNHLNDRLRTLLDERLEFTRTHYGFTGFWVDSFQSTGMHRFTRDARRAPQQRATWEWLAAWSRKGVAFQAESMAFPGQSVSIEADYRDPELWWFLRNTTLWFRGHPMPGAGTPEADAMHFRLMASKCQTASQTADVPDPVARVPSLQRFNFEYNTVLPDMRRGYSLPDGRGTLWLPFSGNQEGVWFSFAEGPVPDGVEAVAVTGNEPARGSVRALHTYRVTAPDLPAAFRLRTPPQNDERIGRSFEFVRPQWNLPEPPPSAADGPP